MKTVLGVVGLGNMGSAIVKGLSCRDDLTIVGFDVNEASMKCLGEKCSMVTARSATELASKADYVIVAVKPQYMKPLLAEIGPVLNKENQCLLSIAAGIRMDQLREDSGTTVPVVRIMPNTPAMIGKGCFAVCLDDAKLSQEQKDFIVSALESLGQVNVLPEQQFDAFTALVGSGPAYVFYFMEAMIEAGVTLGLSRVQATAMTQALCTGSTALVEQSDKHISELREMVCSPAGTTIAATNHMDANAVRATIVEAVNKAYLRSIELGK